SANSVCQTKSRLLQVMTGNGSAYLSKAFRMAVAAAVPKHKRPRPYTPRTNGKAERFIQTSLREWAYARPYASSQERSMALMPWLDHYNIERPHTALAHHPPVVRLRQSQLLGSTKGTVASSRPTANHDRSGEPGQGSPEATGDRRRAASLRRHVAPVTLAQGGSHAGRDEQPPWKRHLDNHLRRPARFREQCTFLSRFTTPTQEMLGL